MKNLVLLIIFCYVVRVNAQDSISSCINIPDIDIPKNLSKPKLANIGKIDSLCANFCGLFKKDEPVRFTGTFNISKHGKIENYNGNMPDKYAVIEGSFRNILTKAVWNSSTVQRNGRRKTILRTIFFVVDCDTNLNLIIELRTFDFNELIHKIEVLCETK